MYKRNVRDIHVNFSFTEEVIRRRLLIDGDGTGDDRRINMLLKSFIKWINSSDVDNTLHERMLSQLAQCEFAQKKSRLVSNMSREELKSYEQLSKEIEIQIEKAKEDIEKTKVELQDAKRVRKNRIEYDVLAKVINEQPDRLETHIKLDTLQQELGALKVWRYLDITFPAWNSYKKIGYVSKYHFSHAGEVRTVGAQVGNAS